MAFSLPNKIFVIAIIKVPELVMSFQKVVTGLRFTNVNQYTRRNSSYLSQPIVN